MLEIWDNAGDSFDKGLWNCETFLFWNFQKWGGYPEWRGGYFSNGGMEVGLNSSRNCVHIIDVTDGSGIVTHESHVSHGKDTL